MIYKKLWNYSNLCTSPPPLKPSLFHSVVIFFLLLAKNTSLLHIFYIFATYVQIKHVIM